jgi:hypothetical protein
VPFFAGADGGIRGAAYELTGGEAFTLTEAAETITRETAARSPTWRRRASRGGRPARRTGISRAG